MITQRNGTEETQFDNFERAMQESKASFGHCQTSEMELLCGDLKSKKLITIFEKKLHRRYLTGSSTSLEIFKFRTSHFS